MESLLKQEIVNPDSKTSQFVCHIKKVMREVFGLPFTQEEFEKFIDTINTFEEMQVAEQANNMIQSINDDPTQVSIGTDILRDIKGEEHLERGEKAEYIYRNISRVMETLKYIANNKKIDPSVQNKAHNAHTTIEHIFSTEIRDRSIREVDGMIPVLFYPNDFAHSIAKIRDIAQDVINNN